MTTRTPEEQLLDDAEAYAKAYGVSVRAGVEAIRAGEELELLARAHHAENPHLTYEQAASEFYFTPRGKELYATANPRPRSKTKAVQVSPKIMFQARAALNEATYPRRPTNMTEAKIVEEALRLLIDYLSDPDPSPARPEGITGIARFDE